MKRIIAAILILLLLVGCTGTSESSSFNISSQSASQQVTPADSGPKMKIDTIGYGIIGLAETGKLFLSNFTEARADECLEWEDIVDFVTGGYLIAAIDSTGKLYCVNLIAQDGRQISTEGYTDIVDLAYIQNALVLLHSDGTLSTVGELSEEYDISAIDSWSDIKMIKASYSHIVGLKADGTVVACGRNDNGECNTAHLSDIVFIDADYGKTAAVDSDGNAYGIGDTQNGALAFDGWSDIVSLSLGPFYSLGVTASGRVIKTVYPNDNGTDEYKLNTVTEQTDVVQACAEYQLCIWLCADGSVGVAGHNANEQTVYDWNLLTGTNKSEQNTPNSLTASREELEKYEDRILSTDNYTIGFKEDGTVLFSGKNPYAFRELEDWENIIDYAAGPDIIYGLTADGHVQYTHSISESLLGDVHLDEVIEWENIISITAFGDTCIALCENGDIYANRDMKDYYIASHVDGAVEIDATGYTLAVLLDDDTVKVYGQNVYWGFERVEAQAAQAGKCVQAAGVMNGIFLMENGDVAALMIDGASANFDTAYLTDWHFVVKLCPTTSGVYGIRKDGTVLGYANMQDFDAMKAVADWTDIVAVAGGGIHVVGLKADGTVVAYGSNYSGQLNVEGWDLW